MGRSRRKLNKFRPKISVKPRKKPFSRSKTPLEIAAQRPDVEKKLGVKPTWDATERLDSNYKANGFLADPNAGFGRNKAADIIQEKAEALEQADEQPESDDDLRQAEGKARHDGTKTALPKPTTQQQRVIQRLVAAHGDNIEAMVKDRKLNAMLLPASKLRRLIEAYRLYGKHGRCIFRVPIKGL